MNDLIKSLTGETQARLLALLRRSRLSITDLARLLQLSDNAVRTHVVALVRDGAVEDVGTQKATGGKPARIYGLTSQGEELFPKAYAVVLGCILEEIARQDGRAHVVELLNAVGERIAAGIPAAVDLPARVASAAEALRALGGDIEARQTDEGWHLQGYACPLSAVASEHAEVCALAQALVARITGREVVEKCDRSRRPRCAFEVRASETPDTSAA